MELDKLIALIAAIGTATVSIVGAMGLLIVRVNKAWLELRASRVDLANWREEGAAELQTLTSKVDVNGRHIKVQEQLTIAREEAVELAKVVAGLTAELAKLELNQQLGRRATARYDRRVPPRVRRPARRRAKR